MPTRSQEREYDVMMEISVQRNLDMTMVAREGYTVLDYLSDIGGMQGILVGTFTFILKLWNYNYLEDHLVSKLFKFRETKFEADDADKGLLEMRLHPLDNFRGLCRDFLQVLVSRVRCCQPDRRM